MNDILITSIVIFFISFTTEIACADNSLFDSGDCEPENNIVSRTKLVQDYRHSIFKVYGRKRTGKRGAPWGTAVLVYDNKWFLTASHVHDINYNSEYIENELILVNEVGEEIHTKIVSKGDFYKKIDFAILRAMDGAQLDLIKPVELSWNSSKMGEKVFTIGFPLEQQKLESWDIGTVNHAGNLYTFRMTQPRNGESGSLVFKNNGKATGILIGSDRISDKDVGVGWVLPIHTQELLSNFTKTVSPGKHLLTWKDKFKKNINNRKALKRLAEYFKCNSGLSQSDLILLIHDIEHNLEFYSEILKSHGASFYIALHSNGLIKRSSNFLYWLFSKNLIDSDSLAQYSLDILLYNKAFLANSNNNTTDSARKKLISKRSLRIVDSLYGKISSSAYNLNNKVLLSDSFQLAAELHSKLYGLEKSKDRKKISKYIINSIKSNPNNISVASMAHDVIAASRINEDQHLNELTTVIDENYKLWNSNILENYAVTDKTLKNINIISDYTNEISKQRPPIAADTGRVTPLSTEKMFGIGNATRAIKDLINHDPM